MRQSAHASLTHQQDHPPRRVVPAHNYKGLTMHDEGGYHTGDSGSGRGYGHERGRSPRGRGGRGDGGGGGVPLTDLDPALTEVSRKLIGCAIEVHKALGPGLDEGVYHKALEIELRNQGVPFVSKGQLEVKYQGQTVGHALADMIVDNKFIVDIMAHRGEIGGSERGSLRALLRVADMELGLVINFAERRLKDGLVRVLNPDKINARLGRDGHDHDHDDHDGHDGEPMA